MRRCLKIAAVVALITGGLTIATAGARPAAAAPIVPATPWQVAPVAAIPADVIQIPNAAPGVGFTAVSEYQLKVDLNGDGDTNDFGLERVDPSTGISIPFVGAVLDFANFDPASGASHQFVDYVDLGESVRGGLFIWAAERPGIDLDGDGAANHTGYFWASGSGIARFVRAGKPYLPLYSSISIGAMYGQGAGVVVAESETDRNADLDGNGTVDVGHFDIINLHAGGTATVAHVQTIADPSLTHLHDGSVGGSLFVGTDGSMRTYNPDARVVGHIGDAVYRNVVLELRVAVGTAAAGPPGDCCGRSWRTSCCSGRELGVVGAIRGCGRSRREWRWNHRSDDLRNLPRRGGLHEDVLCRGAIRPANP